MVKSQIIRLYGLKVLHLEWLFYFSEVIYCFKLIPQEQHRHDLMGHQSASLNCAVRIEVFLRTCFLSSHIAGVKALQFNLMHTLRPFINDVIYIYTYNKNVYSILVIFHFA